VAARRRPLPHNLLGFVDLETGLLRMLHHPRGYLLAGHRPDSRMRRGRRCSKSGAAYSDSPQLPPPVQPEHLSIGAARCRGFFYEADQSKGGGGSSGAPCPPWMRLIASAASMSIAVARILARLFKYVGDRLHLLRGQRRSAKPPIQPD
jgi:hypothetical protein